MIEGNDTIMFNYLMISSQINPENLGRISVTIHEIHMKLWKPFYTMAMKS